MRLSERSRLLRPSSGFTAGDALAPGADLGRSHGEPRDRRRWLVSGDGGPARHPCDPRACSSCWWPATYNRTALLHRRVDLGASSVPIGCDRVRSFRAAPSTSRPACPSSWHPRRFHSRRVSRRRPRRPAVAAPAAAPAHPPPGAGRPRLPPRPKWPGCPCARRDRWRDRGAGRPLLPPPPPHRPPPRTPRSPSIRGLRQDPEGAPGEGKPAKRVAEGQARRAAMIAARKKAPGEA